MNNQQSNEFNRRDFLKGGSMAALMAMMGGIELRAEDAPTNAAPALTEIPVGPTVKYGIIGLGPWAREIMTELGKMPNAPVVAVCDHYPASLRKMSALVPKAEKFSDYHKLLESKEVQAVIVATPTHQHRDVVLDALKAGKHVYCEAPMANSIEDAKIIANAAKAAVKQVFQVGLSARSYTPIIKPQKGLLSYVRAGAAGNPVLARAQWHKKTSWRFAAANADREKAINWRLQKEISLGLIGEAGIQQIDMMTWFLMNRPTAVTGFGSVVGQKDGRDVPDTVQAIFEYPGGVNFIFEASLGTSFDSEYEVFHGSDGTIMRRGSKSWMFKEPDSALLGWEVYARKDLFFGETGISLAAGATNQKALKAGESSAQDPFPHQPLYYALEAFTTNVGIVGAAVDDYVANFGDGDAAGLQEQLATLKTQPTAGWKEGFEATVLAIKANEAVMKKERVVLKDEMFQI